MTRSNSAVAGGISVTKPNARTWAAFDALPSAIRRAMWATPVPVNPVSITEIVEEYGRSEALRCLWMAVDEEVRVFAVQHLDAHGYALPHAAAGASLQPY